MLLNYLPITIIDAVIPVVLAGNTNPCNIANTAELLTVVLNVTEVSVFVFTMQLGCAVIDALLFAPATLILSIAVNPALEISTTWALAVVMGTVASHILPGFGTMPEALYHVIIGLYSIGFAKANKHMAMDAMIMEKTLSVAVLVILDS